MRLDLRCLLSASVLLGLAVSPLVLPVSAQDPPERPQDATKTEQGVREQNIYIPYEKLREVFEKHGRGVFLPYEKFQELWQAAREKTAPPAEVKPPVGAVITEIANEATVAKDVVRVKAVLKIEVLAEGWNEIPLRLADAAIISATIDGKPARLIAAEGQSYRLLVEKKGKQPEQIELALEYAKAITRSPGQNMVSLQAPRAPVSRWRVRIPQSGVKVNIHPLIAATEAPPGDGGENGDPPDETVVLAFVGAAPVVRIDWTPKAEGATGLAALASVQAEQQVHIDEGVTRTRTRLAYTISRAELPQLSIEVPADQKVVNVFDANVRQWSVERADADAPQQQITVELFEPAKDTQQFTIELEKFAGDQPQSALPLPVVKALGVGRQQGVVVVRIAAGLRAEATRTGGLLQLDAADLPGSLARQKWAFSYRYATVPFELALSVEKVQPRILAESLVEAYLQPERLSIDLGAIYTVERAGVFRLELDVPDGYEVRRVAGRDLAGAKAVQVDTHHLEGEDNTRLVVNLARKALGRVALAVELEKELKQPDLLSPTGNSADVPLALPVVAPDTVERAAGRLVIYAPESLRVSPAESEGLRSISFAEALEEMQSTRNLRKSMDVRPVLAFQYAREPVTLRLDAQRRKPQVTIEQLLVARIETGVVKYRATFFYTILYSGVKSLRIDVPAEVAADLRNKTPGVQEKVIDPAPDDLAEGDVAWRLTGESELLGKGKIELVWEKKIDKLGIGKNVKLEVPRLKPRQVDRAWGQIVLAKAETIDVRPEGEPKALRPIDPQRDLIAKVAGAARAFEFHDDWQLAITATQYEMEEVKRTSIERGVVRTVVTPAGEVSVQALYRMRSARQRLAVNLPVNVDFDTEPLRINGRPVTLERGKPGEFFVPLVDPNADEPFLLELRYTITGKGSRVHRLDLPVFPSDPAVAKVYLCAYLPDDLALLGTSGPWTEEFDWWFDLPLAWRLRLNLGHDYLVSWVAEGVQLTGNPAKTFQTDGQLYVFSTLRPAGPPDGSLKITTRNRDLLHAGVFIVVIVGGLLLLPVRTGGRALAVGTLIVVLVLLGVFCPSFSVQVLDGVLAAAIFIVLVVWVVWYFWWTRPRAKAAGEIPQPPQPPPAPAAEEAPAVEGSPAPEDSSGKTDNDEGGKTDA